MRSHRRWLLIASCLSACSESVVQGRDDGAVPPDDLASSDASLIEVLLTPRLPTAGLRESVAFSAVVTGAADQRVTWTLAGPGCTGATCGEIDATGHYRAPWCLPTPAAVTVTATPMAAPSRAASTAITLTRGAPEIAGRYAFSFTGTNDAGTVHVAGTFRVDGTGAVTDGLQDFVYAGGVSSAAPFTGSATSSCYRRGRLALDFGGGRLRTFAWAVDAAGDRFRFLQIDDSGERGAGVARRVDAAALTSGAFAGDHALSADGTLPDPRVRAALLGSFHADAQSTLSSGRLDVNQGGTVSTSTTLDGRYDLDAATGRGTASLTTTGPAARTFHFAFYPFATGESFWVSSDVPGASVPGVGGRAVRRSGAPYGAASLGGSLLLTLVGLAPGTENSAATIGLVVARDDGSLQGGPLDDNDDARVSAIASLSGTWAFDPPGSGRGALHLVYPGGAGGRDLTFLLVAPGSALLLDGTGQQAGTRVATGELSARTGEPFSTAALQGDYVLGTAVVPSRFTPLEVGVLQFDGVGAAAGMGDTSDIFSSHPDRGLLSGMITIPAGGRLPAGDSVFWLVSPTRSWSLSLSAQQHQPTLTVVER